MYPVLTQGVSSNSASDRTGRTDRLSAGGCQYPGRYQDHRLHGCHPSRTIRSLTRAKELDVPMLTRAQLLGQIMAHYARSIAVAGTHGKTTTTSMISQVLLCGQEDPTISVGGILKAIGSNIHVGNSDILYHRGMRVHQQLPLFLPEIQHYFKYRSRTSGFFKDLADVRSSFHKFAGNTKADGALIINGEIPDYQEITEGLSCQVITFGFTDACDYYPKDITYNELGCATFTPVHKGRGSSSRVPFRSGSAQCRQCPFLHRALSGYGSSLGADCRRTASFRWC